MIEHNWLGLILFAAWTIGCFQAGCWITKKEAREEEARQSRTSNEEED